MWKPAIAKYTAAAFQPPSSRSMIILSQSESLSSFRVFVGHIVCSTFKTSVSADRHTWQWTFFARTFCFPNTDYVIILRKIWSFVLFIKKRTQAWICLHVIRSEQQSLLRSVDELTEDIRKREREVAFSVFLFVGVFFNCWAPCFFMENVIRLDDKEPNNLKMSRTGLGFWPW